VLISAHSGYPRWINSGADFIEIDIRRDASGVVVLAHDELKPGDNPVTLAHVLEIAGGRIGFQLDLKEAGYEPEVVMAALDRMKPERLVVTTEHDSSINIIKSHFPQVRVGASRQQVERGNADFVSLEEVYATEDALEYCRRNAIPVWIWTVDDKKQMKRLIADRRVECLITNRPDRAMKLRSARS